MDDVELVVSPALPLLGEPAVADRLLCLTRPDGSMWGWMQQSTLDDVVVYARGPRDGILGWLIARRPPSSWIIDLGEAFVQLGVFVDPHHRRRGLARRLVHRLVEALLADTDVVEVHSDPGSPALARILGAWPCRSPGRLGGSGARQWVEAWRVTTIRPAAEERLPDLPAIPDLPALPELPRLDLGLEASDVVVRPRPRHVADRQDGAELLNPRRRRKGVVPFDVAPRRRRRRDPHPGEADAG